MLVQALKLADERGRKIEQQAHRIEQLLRQLYGRRSEKLDPNQCKLPFEDISSGPTPISDDQDSSPESPTSEAGDEKHRLGKGHGRRRLPAHLARRRVEYRLPDDRRRCRCGSELHVVGAEDPSSHLEYYPALFFVWEQVRIKYGCRSCSGPIVTGTHPVVVDSPDVIPDSSTSTPSRSEDDTSSSLDASSPSASDSCSSSGSTDASQNASQSPKTSAQVSLPRDVLPLPRPIEKGLPGPGLLAHMLTSKYADHLPLYRLSGIYGRSGVSIARSTLCGWVRACADLLCPLWELMAQMVVLSALIHTDDTVYPVLDKQLDEVRKSRVWVYWGDDDHPYVVYDFTTSRHRDGPVAFLKDFRGYLQADGYGGYDGIYKSRWAVEVACFAHARRKYFDAQTTDLVRAQRALAYIGALYAVEREAKQIKKDQQLSREAFYSLRYRMRQERSVGLLKTFRDWIDSDDCKGVLPKSPMATALGYTINQWDALNRYVEDGRLEIDNNTAEREMKAIATGRKNWLFSGNSGGARNGAIIYSFVRTCKRLGIDPCVYLRDVLTRIPDHPKDRLHELLPDRWKATHMN